MITSVNFSHDRKKVATRAAFIKVVKNTVEDLNISYNDYKHERHYE